MVALGDVEIALVDEVGIEVGGVVRRGLGDAGFIGIDDVVVLNVCAHGVDSPAGNGSPSWR